MLDGIDGGYFGFYIGTSPEKEASAIKAMWSEIEKLKSKAPSEDEWARSQAFYSGHHEIEQQYFASQCLGMALDELYGNGYQHYLNFIERFSKITPKLIHQAANEIFNQVYVQARVGK
jgi:predicted Zn-dependent peptidase